MIIYPNFNQEGTGLSSTGPPGAKIMFFPLIMFITTYPHFDVSFSNIILYYVLSFFKQQISQQTCM